MSKSHVLLSCRGNLYRHSTPNFAPAIQSTVACRKTGVGIEGHASPTISNSAIDRVNVTEIRRTLNCRQPSLTLFPDAGEATHGQKAWQESTDAICAAASSKSFLVAEDAWDAVPALLAMGQARPQLHVSNEARFAEIAIKAGALTFDSAPPANS
jgi:hypothetical protein